MKEQVKISLKVEKTNIRCPRRYGNGINDGRRKEWYRDKSPYGKKSVIWHKKNKMVSGKQNGKLKQKKS